MKRKRLYKKLRPRNLFAIHLLAEGEPGIWATMVLDAYQQELFKVIGKVHKIDMSSKHGYAKLIIKLLEQHVAEEKLARALEGNYESIEQ